MLLLVLLLTEMNLMAGSGVVKTSDGKKFEGEIHFQSGAIVISNTNQTNIAVPLANLSLLQFRAPPPLEDASSPTGGANGLTRANPGRPHLPAGILLASGSMIARRISSADETGVRFFETTNEMVLSSVNVARILFQPLPLELESRIQPGRAGLLLSNKEFVESEFKSFMNGKIKANSVLFGITSYDPGQVIAVILRDARPTPARYKIKTRDESIFLAQTIRIEDNAIVLKDPILHGTKILPTDLVEVRVSATGLSAASRKVP